MKKTFYYGLALVVLICLSVLVATYLILRVTEYVPTVLPEDGIPSTGIVTAGPIALDVYERDKVTPLTNLSWGTVTPTQYKHHVAWIYSPPGDATVRVTWTNDAPYYIDQVIYTEATTGGWYLWKKDSVRGLPSDGWLRIDFVLTAVADAPLETFAYNITFTTI